jgi:hypothetical protein
MKKINIHLGYISKLGLIVLWTLSGSSWTGTLRGGDSGQKGTYDLQAKSLSHNRSLQPRSLFECLPAEEVTERKLSASDRRIGTDILCALTRGTYTRNGTPLNISQEDRRRGLPKSIILEIILPYFSKEKFRLYRTIDFTDKTIERDIEYALRRGTLDCTGKPLLGVPQREGMPYDIRTHIHKFVGTQPIEQMHPAACKITNDGYLITIDRKGNWHRYNIATGKGDLQTVIPTIASARLTITHTANFNFSPAGEAIVMYDISNDKHCIVSIDKYGQQMGEVEQMYVGDSDFSQVVFLPHQQIIITQNGKTEIVKYNMKHMTEVTHQRFDDSCVSALTQLNAEYFAALIHKTEGLKTTSLHIINTDTLQTVHTINLDAQYTSGAYKKIQYLENGKFLVYANGSNYGYYIIDINQHDLHCNGQDFSVPCISKSVLLRTTSCYGNRYVTLGSQGDLFLGDTRRQTFQKIFPAAGNRYACSVDLTKNYLTIHNLLSQNNVTVLQSLMIPDIDYTRSQNGTSSMETQPHTPAPTSTTEQHSEAPPALQHTPEISHEAPEEDESSTEKDSESSCIIS